MGRICVVFKCQSRDPTKNKTTEEQKKCLKLSFFRFPFQDKKRCQLWIDALGFQDWAPTKSSRICSNHFSKDSFYESKSKAHSLKENAVPTIFDSFTYLQKKTYNESQKSCSLKALINIWKGSLKFVQPPHDDCSSSTTFNIEFTFDCDVRCAITILHFCTEAVTELGFIYKCRDTSLNSKTFQYEGGKNQLFSQTCHLFDPSQHFTDKGEIPGIPIVIFCTTVEGDDQVQSHVTTARVMKISDVWHPIIEKQIYFLHGKVFLLQSIKGSEYLTTVRSKFSHKGDNQVSLNCPSEIKSSVFNDINEHKDELSDSSVVNPERCQYCASLKNNGNNNCFNKDCLVNICKKTNLRVTLEQLKISEFGAKKVFTTSIEESSTCFTYNAPKRFRIMQQKKKPFSKRRRKSGALCEDLNERTNLIKSSNNNEKWERIIFKNIEIKEEPMEYNSEIIFKNIEIKEEPMEYNSEDTSPTCNFDDELRDPASENVQNSLVFDNVSHTATKEVLSLPVNKLEFNSKKSLSEKIKWKNLNKKKTSFKFGMKKGPNGFIYFCLVCEFISKKACAMGNHVKIHNKTHSSTPCEIKCTSGEGLQDYINRPIHSKSNELSCANCDFKTFILDSFVSHLKDCPNERILSCVNLCSYRTDKKEDLVKHHQHCRHIAPLDSVCKVLNLIPSANQEVATVQNKSSVESMGAEFKDTDVDIKITNSLSLKDQSNKVGELFDVNASNTLCDKETEISYFSSESSQKIELGLNDNNFISSNKPKENSIKVNTECIGQIGTTEKNAKLDFNSETIHKFGVRTEPNGFTYFCMKCEFTSKQPGAMGNHIKIHNRKFFTPLCKQKYTSIKDLHNHLNVHSISNELCCANCDFKTLYKDYYISHMKDCQNQPIFSCIKCSFRANTKKDLNSHILHCLPISSLGSVHKDMNLSSISDVRKENEFNLKCQLNIEDAKAFGCEEFIEHSNDLNKDSATKGTNLIIQDGNILSIMKEKLFENYINRPIKKKPRNVIQACGVQDNDVTSAFQLFECSQCDYSSKNKSNFRNHLFIHSDERQFSCSYCNYQAKQSAGLRAHLKVHKDEKPYHCKLCAYKCKRKQNLVQHSRIHLNGRIFKCPYCKYFCNMKQALEKHIYRKHCLAQCSNEGKVHSNVFKSFKTVSAESNYLKVKIPGDCTNLKDDLHSIIYVCSECNFNSKKKCAMGNHIKSHQLKYSCSLCDFKCALTERFRMHLIKHSKSSIFHCSFCNYKTSVSNAYITHLKIHKNRKINDKSISENLKMYSISFQCKSCFFCTISKQEIQKHHIKCKSTNLLFSDNELSSAPEIPSKTINLEGRFDAASTSVSEGSCTKDEISKRPSSVDYCSREDHRVEQKNVDREKMRFEVETENLLITDSVQTAQNQFYQVSSENSEVVSDEPISSVIDKSVKEPVKSDILGLNSCIPPIDNMKVKTPEKGQAYFDCSFCEYTSVNKSNFRNHLFIHSDERLFSCSYCSYQARQSAGLRAHLKVHIDEKPYHCKLCSYKCKRRQNLVQHIQIHLKNKHKPFKCSYCRYFCTTKQALEKHTNCKHQFVQCSKDMKIDSNILQNFKNESVESNYFKEKILGDCMRLEDELHSIIYVCSECNFNSKKKCAMGNHIKSHQLKYSCPLCDFKCALAERFRMHLRTHSKSSIFICSSCNYKTSFSNTYIAHLRLHKTCKINDKSISKNLKMYSVSHQCKSCFFCTISEQEIQKHLIKCKSTKLSFCDDGPTSAIDIHKDTICLKENFADSAGSVKSLAVNSDLDIENGISKSQTSFENNLRYECLVKKEKVEGHLTDDELFDDDWEMSHEIKTEKLSASDSLQNDLSQLDHDQVQPENIKISRFKNESVESALLKKKIFQDCMRFEDELHRIIYVCSECDFFSKRKCAIGNHIKTHQLKYSCPLCDFKCVLTEIYHMHLRTHSKSSIFVCSLCNYKTSITNAYITHLNIHKKRKINIKRFGEKLQMYSISFQCKSCFFCSLSEQEIQEHHIKCKSTNLPSSDDGPTSAMNVPKNTIFFKENFDGSASSEELLASDSLQTAQSQLEQVPSQIIEVASDEPILSVIDNRVNKTVKCVISGLNSCLPSNIGNMKVKTPVKGQAYFECTLCEYTTTNKSNFRNHLFIHSDERQFSCQYCQYQAKQNSALRAHLKIHKIAKPYHCKLCSYKCKRKHNLVQHIRVHSNSKVFDCDNCYYSTTTKQALQKHHCKNDKIVVMSEEGMESNMKELHKLESEGPDPLNIDLFEDKGHHGDNTSSSSPIIRNSFLCPLCDYICSHKEQMVCHLKIHS